MDVQLPATMRCFSFRRWGYYLWAFVLLGLWGCGGGDKTAQDTEDFDPTPSAQLDTADHGQQMWTPPEQGSNPLASGNPLLQFNDQLVEVAEQTNPAVVTIYTERIYRVRERTSPYAAHPFHQFFQGGSREREYVQEGLGSGVIITGEGYVLTNHHVIDQADRVYVKTMDDTEYEARIVGSDSKTDLALLQVDAGKSLPAVRIGDSDALRVGELVLAIGSPLNRNLDHSVTMGIVSAKGRANVGLADYEDFIQTDAAINPGNSGGALINMRGELVGINTAIASKTGGYQGIGFAIPMNMARVVVGSLLREGRVVRGYLGVLPGDLTPELARSLGIPEDTRGVLVNEVIEGGPAAVAGLRSGDVVVSLDGEPVDDALQFRNRIALMQPGAMLRLSVLRDGQKRTYEIELEELSFAEQRVSTQIRSQFGFEVASLDDEQVRRLDLEDDSGVIVTEIDRRSEAFRSGLREGDVILTLNKRRIEGVWQFRELIQAAAQGQYILLRVYRNGATFYLAFRMAQG